MAAQRRWFFPSDDVTAGVLMYLQHRFTPEDAAERRDHLRVLIRRLTRRGVSAATIHRALLFAIDQHDVQMRMRPSRRELTRRRAAVARAQKHLDRAIASLRALAPAAPPFFPGFTDDQLLMLRDELLQVPASEPPRMGRPPVAWRLVAEQPLALAKVSAADCHDLFDALGLIALRRREPTGVKRRK